MAKIDPKLAKKDKITALDELVLQNASAVRTLQKRDTDDQVDRIIERKLAHIPVSVLASARDSAGLSPRDVLAEGIKALRGSRKNLASEFWIKFYDRFDLNQDTANTELEVSEGYELTDQHLIAALQSCHNKNPVKRTTANFTSFFAEAEGLSADDVVGCYKASMESAVVSKTNSAHMLSAIAGYIGRTTCIY